MGFISRGIQLTVTSGNEDEVFSSTNVLMQELSRSRPSSHAAVNLYWTIWASPICPLASSWEATIEYVFINSQTDEGSVLSFCELETGRPSLTILFCQTALPALSLCAHSCLRFNSKTLGVLKGTEIFILDIRCYITDEIISMDHISPYEMFWKSDWVSWALRANVSERKMVEFVILKTIRMRSLESAILQFNKKCQALSDTDISRVAWEIMPKDGGILQGTMRNIATERIIKGYMGVERPWYNCGTTGAVAELENVWKNGGAARSLGFNSGTMKSVEDNLLTRCSRGRACTPCAEGLNLDHAGRIEGRRQIIETAAKVQDKTGGFQSYLDKIVPTLLSGAGKMLSAGVKAVLGL